MKIKIKIIKTSSEERVSSIDDLLLEILVRLPIRSLIRFKCVSKRWLSLITSPTFSLLRSRNPSPAIGLFLPCIDFHRKKEFDYIHLDRTLSGMNVNPPFKKLKFARDGEKHSGIRILQSCSGLFLCSDFRFSLNRKYYVYNPTTKHFSTLPETASSSATNVEDYDHDHDESVALVSSKTIRGMSLAFYPAKSAHYKVVCIRDSDDVPGHYQTEVYSSETGPWRVTGDPFTSTAYFSYGVYWNGAIHWIDSGDEIDFISLNIVCFNLDLELWGTMPVPPLAEGGYVGHFGESCDHLDLILVYEQESRFEVWEVKRDCSEWFVKYVVDLKQASVAFSRMISAEVEISDFVCLGNFKILSLVRGTRDEDSFLVLQIPGLSLRYNLVDESFDKLSDIDVEINFRYTDSVFQYIESLCCV